MTRQEQIIQAAKQAEKKLGFAQIVKDTKRCDFNHSHLMLAARKGIELVIKAQQGKA